MKNQPRFSRKSIDFIAKASRQKSSTWLERNRAEYEAVLVEPMRVLMTEVARQLRQEAPAGYRFPTRGFARIRRSAENARTQGPYRDWIGASVSRDSGSRYEDLPSLYFNISKEDVFSAGGLYMPSAAQTKKIRAWIDRDPSELEELLADRKFRRHYKDLGDERVLKTKPRDYPIDHPKINWLKMTGWYVWRPIPKKELFSRNFADRLAEDWRQALRLNQVLDGYTRAFPKSGPLEKLEEIQAPKVDSWD
ncbi:MAG: DUF2461 domain-containing protein [Oligoflexia bacterium]|nr:DUF2461 domain-containing protein [Oligoflexia bacterium]